MIVHWAERGEANNFEAGVSPIFLYRLSDRALFETEVEFELPEEEETETALEYAQVDYLLNDYMTLMAGKFLLPFEEYIERAHQKWIDPLVSRPRSGERG